MNLVETLIHYRKFFLARQALSLFGIEFPSAVKCGTDLQIVHRGFGIVVHPLTIIGNGVTLFHGVTIGRSDAHVPFERSNMEAIVIEDEAILFPGCVVLGGPGITRIGKGTIIAANAVLTSSTGEREIWGGIPARKLRARRKGE